MGFNMICSIVHVHLLSQAGWIRLLPLDSQSRVVLIL